MKSRVPDLMKEFRVKSGLSQTQMAQIGGVSQSTYARYESKQANIPTDVVRRIADQLNFPRLAIEHNNENNLGFFKTLYLDKVDDHYLIVLYRMVKELKEAITATEKIIELLLNKQGELTEEELEELYKQELQVADVRTCMNMHWASLAKYFSQFKIKVLEKLQAARMKKKKYCS
ncbi:helix-turn-helix domain-containing protein [Marinisporobacter balticus]|uniref:Helix-turn-helix protein n=1 Tax=Marinisporobacter balticus TaxID=2018667 RepID=A0A4R2K860_9FIRM|nr:helix-turn-helix transcriptional regulator [Marinisporobacter balticus]TCO69543.1 helix-turn-helix protein [Marinisporobacter balticus]